MSCKDPRKITGEIFEVERFAIHDGEGIRTTVFFSGCPLRCAWCANPESQRRTAQIMYWKSRCIGCMACVRECPKKALEPGPDGLIRESACVYCGHCVEVCTAMAQTWIGTVRTAEELFAELMRDKCFFQNTNGGVTFSGGEALQQSEFLIAVAEMCHEAGISTALETSGYAPEKTLAAAAEVIDEFLFDFKCMDSHRHEQLTGVGNERILKNFEWLVAHGMRVRARYPVIGGYNDDEDNVDQLIAYLQRQCAGCRVDLLPYHTLGVSKYTRLQLAYPAETARRPSEERLSRIREKFQEAGFTVTIGG